MDMQNSRPHCWPNVDGTRRLDVMGDPLSDATCTLSHADNPKDIGQVEWMRFIQTFNRVWTELGHGEDTNPFIDTWDNPDKRLTLNPYHTYTVNGNTYDYCEEYWIHIPGNTLSRLKMVFGVYLNNETGLANISCYDGKYEHAAWVAYNLVQKEYEELVSA
jgi:hypothetical protein